MLVLEKETPEDHSYYYHSTASGKAEFREDMVQVWATVLKRVRTCRPDGSWNRLLFELWCAQGFLIVYPQKRGDSPTSRKPRIVVSLEILKDTKRTVDESDDASKVRDALALAYVTVSSAIRGTYNKEPALSELKSTLQTNDFTCWTMHDDDIERIGRFDLIF